MSTLRLSSILLTTAVVLLGTLFLSSQVHAWTIESDFETGTLGRQADDSEGDTSGAYYTWPVKEGGRTVFSNENPHGGKQSAKATVSAGSGGWGEWGLFYDLPEKVYEGGEVWFRAWLYFPTDFKHDPHHGAKGLRIRNADAAGNKKQYFNIYPNEDRIRINNNQDPKGFFENNSVTSFAPEITNWEALEMYIKFSSVSGKGIYRVWRNGKLLFEDTKTRTLEAPGDYANNALIFTLFSNNPSPVTQSTFIDDVVITNETPSARDTHGNPYIGIEGYTPPTQTTCTSFTYSSWGSCQSNNTQTRTVQSSSPSSCSGGSPITSQSCTYTQNTPQVCNKYGPTVGVASGYGASYNVYDTSEMMVSVYCNGDSNITVTSGNGDPYTYVYNQGYYYQNNEWNNFTYSCPNTLIANAWCVGGVEKTLSIPTNGTNYLVSYTCQWSGTKWNCGCANTSCSANYWQLQAYGF